MIQPGPGRKLAVRQNHDPNGQCRGELGNEIHRGSNNPPPTTLSLPNVLKKEVLPTIQPKTINMSKRKMTRDSY